MTNNFCRKIFKYSLLLFLFFCKVTLYGKIYDCFTFFNELELLKVRFEELYDVVDYFVIVEGTRSFNGNEKPLFFKENNMLFENYKDKIIYILVDDFPASKGDIIADHWNIQEYSRNCILRGLTQCKDDDIIFISDLDEIPKKNCIVQIQQYLNHRMLHRDYIHKNSFVCELVMQFLMFKLNLKSPDYWIGGSKAVPYWFLRIHPPWDVKIYHIRDHDQIQHRTYKHYNAGWHFHAMGGSERCVYKWKNTYSTSEVSPDILTKLQTDGAFMESFIQESAKKTIVIPIDSSFPRYIYEHLSYFDSLGWVAK